MICNTLHVCSTLVTLQPVTPSPMLIHAPSFKHTRISTLGKERRSRLGEKVSPQFQSRVSTFDDYCGLIVQFLREKINTVKFRKWAPPCIRSSKYKPPKLVTQKTLRWIAPPNVSPTSACKFFLYLETALKYKEAKTVNFLATIRLGQSILKRKVPSIDKPLRI